MTTPSFDGIARTYGRDGDPGVLLLHPWWGVTPAVEQWATDIAGVGRRVVVPDLYDGQVAATIEEAEALQRAMNGAAAERTVEQCADALAAQSQPWAAMGFSMGAFFACTLAARGTAGPCELILFYGVQPPGGPVERTRRVVLHVVPDDEYCTAEEIAEGEAGFRDAGVDVEVVRYDGSGHWFAERGSPAFDEAAFALAQSHVLDQLRVR